MHGFGDEVDGSFGGCVNTCTIKLLLYKKKKRKRNKKHKGAIETRSSRPKLCR
jgi:hypothetical protein